MTATAQKAAGPRLARLRTALDRYAPISAWLRTYHRADLRFDLISGAVSWAVMVPVAMAYAQMAGAPAQAGLYASIVALTAYAIFGTSRHQKVMASSTMAVMSAAIVGPLAATNVTDYVTLSAALALLVGVLLILAGLTKMGFISDFLSKSVITGFVFGLALTIMISQLPKLFGIPAGSGNFFEQTAQFISNLALTNWWTLGVSAGALAILAFLRWRHPHIPAGPVLLLYGILVVSLFNLDERGVSVVGAVPTGLPQFQIPWFPLEDLLYLLVGALGIVFLAIGESLGTARTYAAKYDYVIDPNQELLALGAANVSAGLLQGITVDASLSQTATAEQTGARTQLASLVSAALILITVVFLASIFSNLPNAVLGLVVINSVVSLMNVGELRRYWRLRRLDFVVAIVALVGVLSTGVLMGLLIAVILSLIFIVYRASRPYIALLGREPDGNGEFGDLLRHPEYEAVPGLLIARLDAPLYFFNAAVAQNDIRSLASNLPPPQAVLVDIGATGELDIPTTDVLTDVARKLRERGITLMLAQVRGNVRDHLRRSGALDAIGEENVFYSVAGGVSVYLQRQAASSQPASSQAAPANQDGKLGQDEAQGQAAPSAELQVQENRNS